MVQRIGTANLPLHYGRVPLWLADRMAKLSAIMNQTIIHHYERDEFLRRLVNPFWFQSFDAVMGMDWHSSGITTSVIGALKRSLTPLSNEHGEEFAQSSGLVAKVDSAAIQDGFDLYLHGLIVTREGKWVVIQQGMNVSIH